jgi:hypothetical protein
MAINTKQVTEFLKLLVEYGDVFKVDPDGFIKNAKTSEYEMIKINDKDLPMVVFSENMKAGKHTFFNPFVEVLGHSAERTWFFWTRSFIVGVMIKEMMKKVVSISLDPSENINYDELDVLRPFCTKVDKKLIDEIDKIEPINILRIVYNKTHRTAQAQTDLFEEKFVSALKIRKGSLETIQGMIVSFLGTEEIHETFKHKATIISMPEMDSFLHVFVKVSLSIHQYVKLLLDRDLHIFEIEQHMEFLEEYRKACAWAVTGTIQHDREAAKEITKSQPPPWRAKEIPSIQPQYIPQMHPQMVGPDYMAGPARVATDPSLFARLASQISMNPYIDANQAIMHNQHQQPSVYGLQNNYGGVIQEQDMRSWNNSPTQMHTSSDAHGVDAIPALKNM